MDGSEVYFANMRDYIAAIDQQDKSSPAVYEQRLSLCKQCDYLADGMCRACGCYVEMRAAMKAKSCPYDKWYSYEENNIE